MDKLFWIGTGMGGAGAITTGVGITKKQKPAIGAGSALLIAGAALAIKEAVAAPPELKANAHGPYNGVVNEPITLHGSASGGAPPYSYAWDLDNDGIFETPGQNPTHVWTEEDSYTVVLQVTDNTGAIATDSAIVNVSRVPVEVAAEITGFTISPISGRPGDSILATIKWKNTGTKSHAFDVVAMFDEKTNEGVHGWGNFLENVELGPGKSKTSNIEIIIPSVPAKSYDGYALICDVERVNEHDYQVIRAYAALLKENMLEVTEVAVAARIEDFAIVA